MNGKNYDSFKELFLFQPANDSLTEKEAGFKGNQPNL